ncbi:MAG: hypothetical protein WCJ60_01650 [bacterium]
MNEYAKLYFALVAQMYRLKAGEALTDMTVQNATDETVTAFKKQYGGLHNIINETKLYRSLRKKKQE